MPRDGSGNYTLPPSNPVVDGTIIDVNWANPTMADIAAQLNNVFTRDGVLGPTGPFHIVDGLVSNPGLSFTNETGMGWYRPSANVTAFATVGAKVGAMDSSAPTATFQSIWPRASGGKSEFKAFARESGSGDGSNLTFGATPGSAYIASYGPDGTSLLPLVLNAADTLLSPTYGYGFFGSTTKLTKAGLILRDYSGPGDPFVVALDAAPAGMVCGFGWSSNGAAGYAELRTGVGSYYFNSLHDAQKSGGAATWTVVSDREAKTGIADYSEGLSAILAVRPRTYQYKNALGAQQYGIVADEIGIVLPQTLRKASKGDMTMFNLDPVFWASINAIQELHARIVDLEANQ